MTVQFGKVKLVQAVKYGPYTHAQVTLTGDDRKVLSKHVKHMGPAAKKAMGFDNKGWKLTLGFSPQEHSLRFVPGHAPMGDPRTFATVGPNMAALYEGVKRRFRPVVEQVIPQLRPGQHAARKQLTQWVQPSISEMPRRVLQAAIRRVMRERQPT